MEQFIEFATNHPLLVGGFFAVLALLIGSEVARQLRGVKELPPGQAVRWINDPDAAVIDISPVADFNKGHIVNARNVPASRLADPDKEIQKMKDRKVLVVCKTGQNATAAAANLKKMGAAEVAILKGGMAQWRSEQFPVTTGSKK